MGKKIGDTGKFENMMRILALLSERRWLSGPVLAKKLHISKRTLYRYINDINIPFEETGIGLIESSREGYKLIDSNFLDTMKGLNDYRVIAAIETSPFGKKLHKKPFIKADIIKKVLSRIPQYNSLPADLLDPLFAALFDNSILTISYKRKNGEIGEYRVIPLRLMYVGHIYYLQLYDYGSEKILNFSVSQIVEIKREEVCKEHALIKEKLEFLESRWGFMADDSRQYIADITFLADNALVNQFLNNPLHESQEYREENGQHIFSLKVHNAQEFVRWSYRYGSHLTFLDPHWVIDIIRKEARIMLAKYK